MNAADLPEDFQLILQDLTEIIRRHRQDGINSAVQAIERLSRDDAHAALFVATFLLADDAVTAVLKDLGAAYAATT